MLCRPILKINDYVAEKNKRNNFFRNGFSVCVRGIASRPKVLNVHNNIIIIPLVISLAFAVNSLFEKWFQRSGIDTFIVLVLLMSFAIRFECMAFVLLIQSIEIVS